MDRDVLIFFAGLVLGFGLARWRALGDGLGRGVLPVLAVVSLTAGGFGIVRGVTLLLSGEWIGGMWTLALCALWFWAVARISWEAFVDGLRAVRNPRASRRKREDDPE